MPVFTINEHQLTLGLSWLPPGSIKAGSSEARKTREFLALKPTPCGYVEIETRSGAQAGTVLDPNDLGYSSAAAWLAFAQRSAVLIEELATDQYWLCAVEDGAVFPSGDLVGSYDQIAARLKEIVSDISGTSIGCYDKTSKFALQNSIPTDFCDLTAGTEPPETITCRPLQARNYKKPILAATATLLLLAVGYGGWQYYSTSTDNSAAKLDLENSNQLANLLEKERGQVVAALEQDLPALLVSLTDLIYERPLRASGWINTTYEWRNGVVTASWERAHGRIADIADHLTEQDYRLDEKSGTIYEVFRLPAPKKIYLDDAETRLAVQRARLQLLDSLAMLPGKWSLRSAEQFGQQFMVNKSRLTGAAVGLTSTFGVAALLRDQPIHVSYIRFSLKRPFSWSMEGEFYETAKSN